jgi:hypothetical protein
VSAMVLSSKGEPRFGQLENQPFRARLGGALLPMPCLMIGYNNKQMNGQIGRAYFSV